VSETYKTAVQKPQGKKNFPKFRPAMPWRRSRKSILLHREALVIILVIIVSIVALTILFSFLWKFFRLGFVCVIAWLLIVVVRKTDSYKLGMENFYISAFLLSYAFSPLLAIAILNAGFWFVYKVFRPDELQGVITQVVATAGIAVTAPFFFAKYGAAITPSQLLFAGVFCAIFWDFVRFLVALKVTPCHWVKLFVSFITGVFINYFLFATFAHPILMFLFTV